MDEKLKLIAEAIGFDEATKAVDALAKAREKLAEAESRAATARTSGTVADLGTAMQDQQRAAEAVRLLGGETGQVAEDADKATVSFSQLLEVLKIADPRAASIAMRLANISRWAGDLATQNINLAATFAQLTSFVRTNAGALALMGATGAVVAGIGLVTAALARQREELKKVTDEIERQREAANKRVETQDAQRASIEGLSDRRREGGLTAAQSRQAEGIARAIRERFSQLDEESVNQSVAGLFGTGASSREMQEAAFLLQTGRLEFRDRDTAGRRLGRFRRAQTRGRSALDQFFPRERVQGHEELQDQFQRELAADNDSDLAIRRAIQQFAGPLATEEEDALVSFLRQNQTVEGIQREQDRQSVSRRVARASGQGNVPADDPERGTTEFDRLAARAVTVLKALNRDPNEAAQSPQPELPPAPRASLEDDWQRRLNDTLQQAQRTQAAMAAERGAVQPVVNISMPNARFVGPGAAAQRQAITNGRTAEKAAADRIP